MGARMDAATEAGGSVWGQIPTVWKVIITIGAIAGAGFTAGGFTARLGLTAQVQANTVAIDSIAAGDVLIINRLDSLDEDYHDLQAGQDYLICDRRRRRSELRGQQWSINCEDVWEDVLRRR